MPSATAPGVRLGRDLALPAESEDAQAVRHGLEPVLIRNLVLDLLDRFVEELDEGPA